MTLRPPWMQYRDHPRAMLARPVPTIWRHTPYGRHRHAHTPFLPPLSAAKARAHTHAHTHTHRRVRTVVQGIAAAAPHTCPLHAPATHTFQRNASCSRRVSLCGCVRISARVAVAQTEGTACALPRLNLSTACNRAGRPLCRVPPAPRAHAHLIQHVQRQLAPLAVTGALVARQRAQHAQMHLVEQRVAPRACNGMHQLLHARTHTHTWVSKGV